LTVNICDSKVSYGYKATEALNVYIRRLEKHNTADLTDQQVNVLIKTAKIILDQISQSENF
jgi:hypothetical protein